MTGTTALGYPYAEAGDNLAQHPTQSNALATRLNDRVGIIARGSVVVPLAASNGAAVTVNFPAGRFTAAPTVVATASTDNLNVFAQVGAITKDNVSIIARHRDSGTTITANVTVHWIAIQQ